MPPFVAGLYVESLPAGEHLGGELVVQPPMQRRRHAGRNQQELVHPREVLEGEDAIIAWRGGGGSETRRVTDGGVVTAGSSVPQASEDEDGDRAGARAEEGRRRGPHVRGEKGTTRPGEAVEEEDEEAGDEGGPTRWR